MHNLVELKVYIVNNQCTGNASYYKQLVGCNFTSGYFQEVSSGRNKYDILPNNDPGSHKENIAS